MSPRERLFGLEQFGIKLGLENIRRILDALNHPEREWTAVHVAGTNGKGSVVAMVDRALRAAGHISGRYTSPHLNDIEERIVIGGEPIAPDAFDVLAEDLLTVVDRLRSSGVLKTSPTFFEVTTAMAFEAFRRRAVTVGVVEAGLGGRFDATNVITPAVAVITSISFDHERHLGRTLAAIAFEKAGIIKPGVPVVIGALPPDARQVIVAEAEKVGAPVLPAATEPYAHFAIGLEGAHQIGNAAVAARTLEACREAGIALRAEDIATGLSQVEWPGRLEWLRVTPHQYVLIDAAHNPGGAQALADYLVAASIAPLPLVLALMRDKDIDAILHALASVVSTFVATAVASERSLPATELAERIERALPSARVISCADADHAIATAFELGQRTVVAGSIFLIGPARARLIARGATPVRVPT